VKWCHEQHKHPFGHLRELRPMNILIDCPRVKQKSAFQKTRRRYLILFRLKWNTDWQMLQPITTSPINNQMTKKNQQTSQRTKWEVTITQSTNTWAGKRKRTLSFKTSLLLS
jgi:hypothetical protein